jgi:hypothetical protein
VHQRRSKPNGSIDCVFKKQIIALVTCYNR